MSQCCTWCCNCVVYIKKKVYWPLFYVDNNDPAELFNVFHVLRVNYWGKSPSTANHLPWGSPNWSIQCLPWRKWSSQEEWHPCDHCPWRRCPPRRPHIDAPPWRKWTVTTHPQKDVHQSILEDNDELKLWYTITIKQPWNEHCVCVTTIQELVGSWNSIISYQWTRR